MMKKKLTRILPCLMLVLLVGLGLYGLGLAMERKDSLEQFQDFYELGSDPQVIFLGSSHVMRAVSPVNLWKEYGITSYNMGSTGCRLGVSYWILKNALRTCQPQLVVLDCAYLLDDKANPKLEYAHRVFDSMPTDLFKAKAVFDLFDRTNQRLELLFPFSIYHNRWKEMNFSDLKPYESHGAMGFFPEWTLKRKKLRDFYAEQVQEVDNASTFYLRRIIEECKSRNLPLLMIYLPFWEDTTSQNDAAYLRDLCQAEGLPFLGPDVLYQVINPKTDFSNHYENNSHLNWKGAMAMTSFLGAYIRDHYDLPAVKGEQTVEEWDSYYEKMKSYKLKLMEKSRDLRGWLVMASDKTFRTEVEIYSRRQKKRNRYLLKDLKKSGGTVTYLLSEQEDLQARVRLYDAEKGDLLMERTF